MIIERPKYVKLLKQAIHDPSIKCVVLDGPRQAGKTTLLQHIYYDNTIDQKKYYFSFDDQLSTKQFKDSQEFISFMQIKFGIDFSEPNLLFLNEIQFSKNIGKIIHNLINIHKIKTKIIATGITQGEYKDFLKLHHKDFIIITIHTLTLEEFLEHKGIHTQHLDPLKMSEIVFAQIEPLVKEFITRGSYPSVVIAKTEEEKKEALKQIIQTIISKDVNFWFHKEEIGYFEEILSIINDENARIHNKRAVKNTYAIPAKIIDKYTRFLEDHFIITTLHHFFSNKKREVSHKKCSLVLDMGLKNYLSDHFHTSIHDPIVMRDVCLQEIFKNIPHKATISMYKKINGSAIEFLINDGTHLTPIVTGDKNTKSVPKVFLGFEETYGKKVSSYIKATPKLSEINYLNGKPVYILPYFLIGKHLETQKNDL